jgi:RHS repeat-associated protein
MPEAPDPTPALSDPGALDPEDELIAERTESSRTFDLGDGRRATEYFVEPAFYQPDGPDGAFVEIEPGFSAVAGPDKAATSDKALAAVTVAPAGDERGFLAVEDQQGFRVALRPLVTDGSLDALARAAEPAIDGTKADLAELFPGVDARVFAQPDATKLYLVLDEPPNTTSWTFLVDVPKGTTMAIDKDTGAVDLFDAKGERRAILLAPYALDSTPDEQAGGGLMTTDVHYTIGEHENGTPTVTVSVDDAAWLAKATYPVYVDPSIYLPGTNTYGDTFVNEGNPSMNYANYQRPDSPYYYEMWMGQSPSQSTYYTEAYLKYDVADLAGMAIDSAVVRVFPYHAYFNAPTSRTVWLRRVLSGGSWTESGLTWNNKPGTASTGVLTSGCVEGEDCDFNALSMIRNWADGSTTNNGLRLDANGNGAEYWKRFIASEAGIPGSPKLVVTYHNPVSLLWPLGGGPTAGRTLTWAFDAPSAQTHYQVDLSTSSSFSSITATSGDVTSAATSWAIPTATSLIAGTTYYWRVRVKFGASVHWSPFVSGSFVHDPTANLGRQPQHTFESWDLGAGDSLDVNVGSGNLVIGHPIVDLPIRGSAVDIALTYNRHDTTSVGMGPGWRLNLHRRLTVNGDGTVTFTDADGARHRFTNPVVNGTVTTYTRPATLYATLVKDTAVSANEFILTYRDQSKDKFDILGSEGILVREEDRFGNGVDVTYVAGTNRISKVRDTAASPAREIDVGYDGSNRVTSITDWAWVSGGVIQANQTGARRVNRFFYDASGNLAGWADPLNTSGSCPTGGSHLTCLTYSATQLDITKTQTYTTIGGSPAALGSATRTATTRVTFSGSDVTTVKDAEEVATSGAGTAFGHVNPAQTQVVRKGNGSASLDTTTRYRLVGSITDPYGRVESAKRKLGSTWIERATSWDGTYPIEPASITDNAGALLSTPERTVSYTYKPNSLGLVARVSEPLDGTYSRWTDYTYNANNDVTETLVSRQGDATLRTRSRNCYNANLNLCGFADSDLRLFKTVDNYVDGIAGGTNGHVEDVTTTYQYDAYGRQIRAIRSNYAAGGMLLDSRVDASAYDDLGNLTAEITNYVDGQVSGGDDVTPNATTNARTDLITRYVYDTAGNRITHTDPRCDIELGAGCLTNDHYVTRWTFDALDQQLSETTPTTPGITITCAATSPNCRQSLSTYDEFGAVRTATDFGNLVTATGYDRAGRALATYEDPPDIGGTKLADTTSESTYDPSGRLLVGKDQIQVDDASRGFTQTNYDELGRVIAVADAVGTAAAVETDTTYDALDRVISVFYGVTAGADTYQTTVTRYDLGGRATEVDDEFTCTRTTYDFRDLPTSTQEGLTPASGSCTGTATRVVTNSHDGLGRLTLSAVTDGLGDGDKLADDVYDAAGNKRSSSAYVAATATTTTVSYALNLLDQVLVETRTDGSVAKSLYDPAGNATERCYWATAPAPDEACQPVGASFTTKPTRHTSASFDARNNRVSLRDGSTNALTVYDPDHNYQTKAVYVPTKFDDSDPAEVDVEHQSLFGYDERHRLVSLTHRTCTVSDQTTHACSATTATGSVAYEYDPNDNRTRVNESNGATSADRRYCFDAQDRLVSRNTGAACSPTVKDESYAFDGAGNRTQAVVGGVTTNFAYNTGGQLCKVGATTCGTPNVTDDTAGRIETWNGWWFRYDAEGRLLTACKSSTCAATADKVAMIYDGEGRRTRIETTPANGATSTREFRYQGDAIVEEKVGGVVARQYLVDESGSVVEMVIPTGSNAGTYVVTWNGHGDALALWRVEGDGSLELANSFSYSTWGKPTISGSHPNSANGSAAYGDLGFRFLYVGEFDVQWDDAFGLDLLYMHARHYSPALGRFLQPDPDRTEANPYAYAANNPVTEIDPDGTCFIVCQIVVGAVIDAVVYVATTDNANLAGLAGAVAGGAVESAVNPFSKLSKASKLISAGQKIFSKVSKATRAYNKVKRARPDAIVRLASQRVARRGAAPLTRNFSAAQSRAARKYKSLQSAYKGTQYHNDVADEVRRIAGRRFQYNRRGPDFLDRRTRVRVELTTKGQLSRHYARPGYGRPSVMMRYVRYGLP